MRRARFTIHRPTPIMLLMSLGTRSGCDTQFLFSDDTRG